MKIVIAKNLHGGLYNIFLVNDSELDMMIDSLGFRDLSEQEAKCRAASLKSVLCCPIVPGECDDELLVRDVSLDEAVERSLSRGWLPFPFPSIRKEG